MGISRKGRGEGGEMHQGREEGTGRGGREEGEKEREEALSGSKGNKQEGRVAEADKNGMERCRIDIQQAGGVCEGRMVWEREKSGERLGRVMQSDDVGLVHLNSFIRNKRIGTW